MTRARGSKHVVQREEGVINIDFKLLLFAYLPKEEVWEKKIAKMIKNTMMMTIRMTVMMIMTTTVMIATQIAGDKCTGNEVAIGDGKAATGSETKYRILKRECIKNTHKNT